MIPSPYPIVDAHVHFWDPHHLHYGWLTGLPPINHPFLPSDLTQAAADATIEKLIFVQADCDPAELFAEVEWVTQLAESHPSIAGIVAFAPLELAAERQAILERLASYPLVKGIRRLIQSEVLGFARQPAFVEGVQLLKAFHLPFDICVTHTQLTDVIYLVEQCPNSRFVLDHMGKPGIKAGAVDRWREEIDILATFPNLHCKLSGLVTEADHTQWTPAQLQPYIDHVLDRFGPKRLMFGSDWPVSTLAAAYPVWLETALTATAHLSDKEQKQIFYQNCLDFYLKE